MMTGSTELIIILGITLILFGPTKLPQLGKAIGESIRNFRKGINNLPESTSEEDHRKAKEIASHKIDN